MCLTMKFIAALNVNFPDKDVIYNSKCQISVSITVEPTFVAYSSIINIVLLKLSPVINKVFEVHIRCLETFIVITYKNISGA